MQLAIQFGFVSLTLIPKPPQKIIVNKQNYNLRWVLVDSIAIPPHVR